MPSAVFIAATVPITAGSGPPEGPAGPAELLQVVLWSEDGTFYVLFEEDDFYVQLEAEETLPEFLGPAPIPTSQGLVDEDIMVEVLVTNNAGTAPALRLSNRGPIFQQIGSAFFQYQPRLITPLQFSQRISSEQYGDPVRGLPNAGAIDFEIDPTIWEAITQGSWPGATFYVKRGNVNNVIFKGRVDTLTYQAGVNPRASIKTMTAVLDLDKPLPRTLYPDDFVIEELRGRPRPWMRGTCFSVEPIYEGNVAPPSHPADARPMYRISWGTNLQNIANVRVGGVLWTEVLTYPPGPSQWFGDPPGGVLFLGGSTDGGGVRCDAESVLPTTWNSATLLREVVQLAGGHTDTDSLTQFSNDAYYWVGYWIGPEHVNTLTVLDEIVASVGGWWAYDHAEAVRCGVIKVPPTAVVPTFTLSAVDIEEFRLVQQILPAKRIRVEYKRNWVPQTNFFTGVDAAAQQQQSAPGLVAPSSNIPGVTTRNVDPPIIRSLLVSQAHAEAVRDRLVAAWGTRRRLYEVQCNLVAMPELYTHVKLNFEMMSGEFWVHSAMWSVGGGPSALQLWG